MGLYSSKYDFYNSLFMSSESEQEAFEKFKGTELYVSQPLPEEVEIEDLMDAHIDIPETYYKKIEYHSINDLIPYYPYIISFSCGSRVVLSRRSYVDMEEEDSLQFYLKWIIKEYNRCKRKKVSFNICKVVDEICNNDYNKEPITELAQRVKKHGKKATYEGVHLEMEEYYRKELVKIMLEHGMNPADYGYGRFVENKGVKND